MAFEISMDEAVRVVLDNKLFDLNEKEARICILLVSECKNLLEVAVKMNMAYKTVEHYSRSVKAKTNASSLLQATSWVTVSIMYHFFAA